MAWIDGSARRAAVLSVLLAVLPYLNSLQASFTFDDIDLIRDNPLITGQNASVWQLLTWICNPGGWWRPVTMLSYLLNARVGGGVLAYHLVNICLHAAVTVGIFYLALSLLGSVLGATVAAVVFAVHPIHTEAVSSIVGRAELLAALFVLVCLLALIRAVRHPGRTHKLWLAVSLAALAIGILAKESAFMAIPLCVIVYAWLKSRLPSVHIMLPYALVGIAYLALRVLVVGSLTLSAKPALVDNPLAYVPVMPRLATALVILRQYVSALVIPLRLSADYSFNAIPIVTSELDPRFLVAAALFAVLALALALTARRSPGIALAAAFAVVPLALTANVLFPIGTIKAERLLYLPSFGWCLLCGWFIVQKPPPRRRWLIAVALVTAAYASRTWARNWDWHDNFTLFAATVESSPGSAKAHHDLGTAYSLRGETDMALRQFRLAFAIFPHDPEVAFDVAWMYERRGMDKEALAWYARASELDRCLTKARLNVGLMRLRRGELTAAQSSFSAGVECEPDDPQLHVGLALALLAQGDERGADEHLSRAASLADDPEIAQAVAKVRERLERGDISAKAASQQVLSSCLGLPICTGPAGAGNSTARQGTSGILSRH
jgi:tetratricopeptide (TPR) repeat protein